MKDKLADLVLMEPTFDRGADFSSCARYRYRLWRHWRAGHPPLVFVMLNPSTADAEKNDPTVERCERRARAGGFGGVEIVNLFALRATDPKELYKAESPIAEIASFKNDEAIRYACGRSHAVVAAWGVHGALGRRGEAVAAMLRASQIGLWVLGLTKDGHPRHPLYIPNATPIRPWTERDAILEGAPLGLTPAALPANL